MKKALIIIVMCLPLLLGARCFLFGPAELETVATPTISPASGEYTTAQNVTISCATPDATIYFTTDGEDPTASSSQYVDAISVSQTTTVKAFAVKNGMTDSDIASAIYTITSAAHSILGEWLIDQTYQIYTDNDPIDTMNMTQNITTIMNADGTYTSSGTTQNGDGPQSTLEGNGTYTYDDVAGTVEMVVLSLLVGGDPMTVAPTTYDCEITATTMTLTYPNVEPWMPAEPMIYTRL